MMKHDSIDGFFKQDFMEFMAQEFPVPMGCAFTRDLVDVLVDDMLLHHNTSKDQGAAFLADRIPDVSFLEIGKFFLASSLTASSYKAAQATVKEVRQ